MLFIGSLLKIDPTTRPNIDSVLEHLASMAETMNIDINRSLTVKIPSPIVDIPNPGMVSLKHSLGCCACSLA